MAFPFKTGGDFYNCEAQRMRLHNLGANPTETATGLMYFNTGASNLGKHAVVHDGTNFKALAFVDEIATNAEFVELKEKVDLLIGDDVDTDTIIDSWKEVQAFLADIEDTKTLQGMLSSYLPKSGGTIEGSGAELLKLDSSNASYNAIVFKSSGVAKSEVGFAIGGGAYLFDYTSSKYLGIDVNGTPFFGAISGTGKNTLIHSGNIGEYNAGSADKLTAGAIADANAGQYTDKALRWFAGIANGAANFPSFSGYQNGLLALPLNSSGTTAQIYITAGNGFYFRGHAGVDWKTIAFTDSTVDKAKQLETPRTIWGQSFDGTGNVDGLLTIGYGATTNSISNSIGLHLNRKGASSTASAGIALTNEGVGSLLLGGNGGCLDIYTYDGTTASKRMILNSSGNVTIGGSDFAGSKWKTFITGNTFVYSLVDSNARPTLGNLPEGVFSIGYHANGNVLYGLHMWSEGSGNGVIQASRADGTDKAYPILLNPLGGNVLIGTPNEIKSGAKLQVKGDLYVDGNIIATKEVSAGGAGQEGDSGDGGAEVIDKELAKGQSSYTIPNTIGRSAVAVSLYEWNANNSSWDMCLADISVKDATITVTFGSATSVNHKLVAVG